LTLVGDWKECSRASARGDGRRFTRILWRRRFGSCCEWSPKIRNMCEMYYVNQINPALVCGSLPDAGGRAPMEMQGGEIPPVSATYARSGQYDPSGFRVSMGPSYISSMSPHQGKPRRSKAPTTVIVRPTPASTMACTWKATSTFALASATTLHPLLEGASLRKG
jgi:hypothetical protein